jgi:outer membrane receptor protein involved in Fe transport
VLSKNLIAGLSNINLGTSSRVAETRSRIQDVGFFAQEEFLTLGERLLLTLGGRADESTNNSDPHRLFYYPKAAASFRFPLLTGWVDELKLRAAAGASGNQPLYGQKFTELLAANIAGTPSLQVQGATSAPDLRPEREREFEAGIDATLLRGRASLGITGYEKRITDLLLQRSLPTSSGFTTEFFNGGVLRTRGVEVEFTAVPAQRSDLDWTFSTTFASTRSKVVSLPVPPFSPGGFPVSYGGFRIEQGASPTQIIGNDTLPNGTHVVRRIGDVSPDFKMGFVNNARYRAARIHVLLDWQKGGDVINLTKFLYDLSANTADYDTPVTVGGKTMPLGAYRVATWVNHTAVYVERGTFVKLRELTIAFDIPSALVRRVPGAMRSAQLSLSGRNLLTFTPYTGLDPEVSNFGSQPIARNSDTGPFPPSRSFWLSVDIGF